jgi:hypothetical protein
MNLQRRALLFTVMLATTAWTPVLGQTPSSAAVRPAAQGAASIPDFFGIWGHPYLGFEPPVSGPGPVLNKSRRKQVIDADGRRLPPEQSPLVSNPNDLVGDYTSPILKAGAAETVKRYAEISLTHVIYPTPSNQCWPEPGNYSPPVRRCDSDLKC